MIQPSLSYNLLKFSLQLFGCGIHKLEKGEYQQVQQKAEAECLLQEKILTSDKGLKVIVPGKSVREAVDAIAARYESRDAFEQDLANNNLTLDEMHIALEVDLAVEATLAQVTACVEPPGEKQVAQLYKAADKEKPEQRCLRHILVTINDQFPENSRPSALLRITKIREKALSAGIDFSELAQHYSECPSALQGGTLPPVSRGKIDPGMGKCLFGLEVGEISEVVESPMGFHILLCDKVIKAEELNPDEVKSGIRQQLHGQMKKKELQRWLSAL
ncbi:MAG: peptidylprolyl isomerase [Desulfocapsa sp.]|nr:peptidylprolyl isomerase [Desulfocapsa sp.]